MKAKAELRLRAPATFDRPRMLRHALAEFLVALDVDPDRRDDILTAAGEALANAVEHAYAAGATGTVELHAEFHEPATVIVEVIDRGTYLERASHPDRGFGMRIIRAVANAVSIDVGDGTAVRMQFALDADASFS